MTAKIASPEDLPGRREGPGPAWRPGFYDFFAGAGLVRLGLEPEWRCLWAVDVDPEKAAVYAANFGDAELVVADVAGVRGADLPGRAELAWASFPCQDLSFAGPRRGLEGERSGTFFQFLRVLHELQAEGRMPPVAAVENVMGLLRPGVLEAVMEGLAGLGLQAGALVVDARWFLPQSRPRVFVVAAAEEVVLESGLSLPAPDPASPWTPPEVLHAFRRLPDRLRRAWVWWHLPSPSDPPPALPDLLLLEEAPPDAPWLPHEEVRRLLERMPERHRRLLAFLGERARRAGRPEAFFVHRRIRPGGRMRAEIRVDGRAGCLLAARGGSSVPLLVLADGDGIRMRRLSVREAARLMGVPDNFRLPARRVAAMRALGDGVAVPVLRWLSRHLLLPLARTARLGGKKAFAGPLSAP